MFTATVTANIRERLSSRLPGAIALLDIADCKRRNIYLGWERVDRDILDLEPCVEKVMGDVASVCRVAGDKWLVCGSLSVVTLNELLAAYGRVEPATVIIVSRARIGSKPWREATRMAALSIQRALRCVFIPFCSDLPSLLELATSLQQEDIVRAPVGEAVTAEEVRRRETPERRWQCTADVGWDPACLLCRSAEIEITGGASDAVEGMCRSCGAEVDLSVRPS